MHTLFAPCRPAGRLFYLLISIAVALGVSQAQAPQLTTINDTVYRANGQPAAGSIVLTWPAFTTADNKPVAAGELTVTIAANGAVSVQLAPNQNSVPAGSYYKAVYKLSDGITAIEYWSVPSASPATIGAIRSQIVPASVAAQLVTRQYVDSVLSGAASDLVHKSGAETLTGAKTFTSAVTSSVASGAPPLIVASSAKVANLNADLLDGADWAAPPAIGSATPNSGNFTALQIGGASLNFAHLAGSLAATQLPAFSGDVATATGSSVATVNKVNGVAYPATPAASAVPVITAANTADYRPLPNCLDTGGNHLNYDSASQTFNCGASSAAGVTALTRPNTKRWSYLAASGSGNFTVIGDSNGGSGACTANVAPTATDPVFTNCIQSAATVNTNAGIAGSNPIWRAGRNLSLQFAGKVRENTSVRSWIGLTDQTVPAMLGGDNPAGNYAAFRFSTSAADATVKCVTKDGTTQNIQAAAGIADLTLFRKYEVTEEVAASKWRFYVDGVEVCGPGLSANLPAGGTNLRYIAAQQNLTATQRNIDTAWLHITADK